MYFMGFLEFSEGLKSLGFAIEAGSMEALKSWIHLLCSFKGSIKSFLRRLNVQIARKSLCIIFDDLIVSYYISAIVAVNKEKSEMSFKSCIRPSCSIFGLTNSCVCRLKRLETRVITNQVFL